MLLNRTKIEPEPKSCACAKNKDKKPSDLVEPTPAPHPEEISEPSEEILEPPEEIPDIPPADVPENPPTENSLQALKLHSVVVVDTAEFQESTGDVLRKYYEDLPPIPALIEAEPEAASGYLCCGNKKPPPKKERPPPTKVPVDEDIIKILSTGITKYQPVDATTNPTQIFETSKIPEYLSLVVEAVKYGRANGDNQEEKLTNALDMLFVLYGAELLKNVPGRVSIEVDPRLSFDKEGTVKKAIKLIEMFKNKDVSKERVLMKIAGTWEGIESAAVLEKENGIHCNITLIFTLEQAIACGEAEITMISPFVGRVLDWTIHNSDQKSFEPDEDPGVLLVTKIYNYYKNRGFKTTIMGASFRSVEQIKGLAGCDYLTISPKYLEELQNQTEDVPRKLSPQRATGKNIEHLEMTEVTFRWEVNESQMATEKLSEGIRNFARDTRSIEGILKDMMDNKTY